MRNQPSAILLICAVLITAVGPTVISQHEVCAVKHHTCGNVAQLTGCCGGDIDASGQLGLIQARTELATDQLVVFVFPGVAVPLPFSRHVAAYADSSVLPEEPPPDLSILFADLRL